MVLAMSLRSWAHAEEIDYSAAHRAFHAGQLVDRHGRSVHAEQPRVGGMIRVYPNGPPDPLAAVDPHALVEYLENAGYRIFTSAEADKLGVTQRQRHAAAVG